MVFSLLKHKGFYEHMSSFISFTSKSQKAHCLISFRGTILLIAVMLSAFFVTILKNNDRYESSSDQKNLIFLVGCHFLAKWYSFLSFAEIILNLLIFLKEKMKIIVNNARVIKVNMIVHFGRIRDNVNAWWR